MLNNVIILRVFPRRTNATPDDDLVRIGEPGLFDPPKCDEVHVSCAFSWDRAECNRIATAWERVHSHVSLGGPGWGNRGDEFVPGRYLKLGNVITSRGCPERCWFCDVPQREGPIRELPIRDGWRVHDSNLLACSQTHQEAVFAMLDRQPHRSEFVGGLQAARLTMWHVEAFRRLRPRRMYFAYDTPDDLEPLRRAGEMLAEFNETYCFVLVGYRSDTFAKATRRCEDACRAGFLPFAMLYRHPDGRKVDPAWRKWQRTWCRPQIVRQRKAAVLQ